MVGNALDEEVGSGHDNGRKDRDRAILGVSSSGLSDGDDGWGFKE